MKIILSLTISITCLLFINILAFSLSSLFAIILIYIIGFLFSQKVQKKYKNDSAKLFFYVFSIYLISGYVFSLSFNIRDNFLLSDPTVYIEQFSKNWSLDKSLIIDYLYGCFIKLNDNNALYNLYIRFLANFSNYLFGEASVLYATLGQTIFGILSTLVLYRIILNFQPNKAFKYSFIFAIFSSFHFYSSVIVRDIIIAFLFLLIIEIILKKYTNKNLIKLFILLIIVWGIRLYSGLFVFVFILYYVYLPIRKTKFKPFILPFFILIVIGVLISSYEIINQSIEEISYYVEFSRVRGEQSGGLSNYLLNFPPVIKEIILTLYSQFHPFPPFAPLLSASTFSQFYISTIVFINSIWWALIFYKLLIFLFVKGVFKKILFEFRLLFIISIIFIIANTAHIDIRRMMPIYPILFLIYLNVVETYISASYMKKANVSMMLFITLAIIIYLFLIV